MYLNWVVTYQGMFIPDVEKLLPSSVSVVFLHALVTLLSEKNNLGFDVFIHLYRISNSRGFWICPCRGYI